MLGCGVVSFFDSAGSVGFEVPKSGIAPKVGFAASSVFVIAVLPNGLKPPNVEVTEGTLVAFCVAEAGDAAAVDGTLNLKPEENGEFVGAVVGDGLANEKFTGDDV